MKVTSKGQVTIPLHVREALHIRPALDEVEFLLNEQGEWVIKKLSGTASPDRFRRLRGTATVKMSTDEIMELTRG